MGRGNKFYAISISILNLFFKLNEKNGDSHFGESDESKRRVPLFWNLHNQRWETNKILGRQVAR
jgi:hypothetical protein